MMDRRSLHLRCQCVPDQQSSVQANPLVNRRMFVCGSLAVATALQASTAPTRAQTRWAGSLRESCSFYPGDVIDDDVYTFQSTPQARSVVQRITGVSGLRANFEIMQASVPNAAAVVKEGKRYILYSQTFIDRVTSGSDEWSGLTILAHEVGHHLNGHTLTGTGSRPETELEADYYAGYVVQRLGGTLNAARRVFEGMPTTGSASHPPRLARLEAVAAGWNDANAGRSSQPETARNVPSNRDPGGTAPAPQPSPLPVGPPIHVGNPQAALHQILTTIQQGAFPGLQMSPELHNAVQQAMPAMTQQLRMRGPITAINLVNRQFGPTGASIYFFQVMFPQSAMMWQFAIEQNGLVTGLYGQ